IWASDLTGEQYEGRQLFQFFSWMDDEGPGYSRYGAVRMAPKYLRDQIDPTDVRSRWFLEDGRQRKFGLANKSSYLGNDLFMRTAEMYLIEAEARYRLGDESTAVQVLTDLIASRYENPSDYQPPTSGTALLDEILLQRKIELWGEGFGYEDVRRLNKGLNRPTGPGNFSSAIANNNSITIPAGSPRFIYKIPQREMDNNPSMVQNYLMNLIYIKSGRIIFHFLYFCRNTCFDMSLETEIMAQLKQAMKDKNEVALRTLRAIKSAIIIEKTAGPNIDVLTAEEEIKIIKKLAK